jgi:hypothetical protein
VRRNAWLTSGIVCQPTEEIFNSLSIFLSSLMENSFRSKALNVSGIVPHFQKKAVFESKRESCNEGTDWEDDCKKIFNEAEGFGSASEEKWWRLGRV